jgi:hypothetical protein
VPVSVQRSATVQPSHDSCSDLWVKATVAEPTGTEDASGKVSLVCPKFQSAHEFEPYREDQDSGVKYQGHQSPQESPASTSLSAR